MTKRIGTFIILISSILLLNVSISFACVWVPEDGPTVYWPSTEIKVCFLDQNLSPYTSPSGVRFGNDLTRSHQLIRQAIQEMSDKTRFNFQGFAKCDPNDSSPMIRINLTRQSGEGKTESIGPNSARTRPFNLSLSQIPLQEITQRYDQTTGTTSTFDSVAWNRTATQHEIMHLLGFHHDMPRVNDAKGGGWDRFMSMQGQVRRVDNEFDSHSVMNITGHGSQLSDRDVTCINELAMRTIRYNSINTNPLLTSTSNPQQPGITQNQTPPSTKPRPVQSSSLAPMEEPAAID